MHCKFDRALIVVHALWLAAGVSTKEVGFFLQFCGKKVWLYFCKYGDFCKRNINAITAERQQSSMVIAMLR